MNKRCLRNWIDKVDMVSLQAFTPPNSSHNKDLFQSFFPESFKGNKIKDKPKHKYRILDVCNHFKEWDKK